MTSDPKDRQPRESEVPLEILTPPWPLRHPSWAHSAALQRKGAPQQIPEAPAEQVASAQALTERVRQAIRQRHYSRRTEKAAPRPRTRPSAPFCSSSGNCSAVTWRGSTTPPGPSDRPGSR